MIVMIKTMKVNMEVAAENPGFRKKSRESSFYVNTVKINIWTDR